MKEYGVGAAEKLTVVAVAVVSAFAAARAKQVRQPTRSSDTDTSFASAAHVGTQKDKCAIVQLPLRLVFLLKPNEIKHI